MKEYELHNIIGSIDEKGEKKMQNFLIYGFTAVYYAVMLKLCGRTKFDTRMLTSCGVIIAITLVLRTVFFVLPTTGRVTLLSVLPIMILAVVYGIKPAFYSGLVVGILAIFLQPSWVPVHWAQIIVEHLMCYSCLALVPIFGTDKRYKILLGALLALVLSILGHVFAGVVFFSEYAWEGYGAWTYSIIVNVSAHGVENLMALVVMGILPLNTIKKSIVAN